MKKGTLALEKSRVYVHVFRKYCGKCGVKISKNNLSDNMVLKEPPIVFCKMCGEIVEPYLFERSVKAFLEGDLRETCLKHCKELVRRLSELQRSFEVSVGLKEDGEVDLWEYVMDGNYMWYHVLKGLCVMYGQFEN